MFSDFEFIHIQNCLENKNLGKYRKNKSQKQRKNQKHEKKNCMKTVPFHLTAC
jgi:hypothetical protein